MRRLFVLLALAGCGRLEFGTEGNAIPAGTPHSTLRLDRVANAETLADFPLLVVLDDTRADRMQMSPDASDLRFRDEAGTPLAHEIEQIGLPGGAPLVAWVRVPNVTRASTTITVEYGNGPQSATGPVWSDTYQGVWHMGGAGDVDDASTHDRPGTNGGTTTVAGRIAEARQFDGTTFVRVDKGGGVMLPTMTLSGWMNANTFGTSESKYSDIVTRAFASTAKDDFLLGFNSANAAAIVFHESSVELHVTDTAAISPGVWTHVAMTWDTHVGILYVDGTEVDRADETDPVLSMNDDPIFIGAGFNNNLGGDPTIPDDDGTDGDIDEVRIESTARTAGWMKMDFASQSDAVISYGTVEYN
ncbi:MAG TPA: LamG domain-containing protein [Kofleriaceae bacterium]|jgi:biopolymer transport protein ExbB